MKLPLPIRTCTEYIKTLTYTKSYVFVLLTAERQAPSRFVCAVYIPAPNFDEANKIASQLGLYTPYEAEPHYITHLPRIVAWLFKAVLDKKITTYFIRTLRQPNLKNDNVIWSRTTTLRPMMQ